MSTTKTIKVKKHVHGAPKVGPLGKQDRGTYAKPQTKPTERTSH